MFDPGDCTERWKARCEWSEGGHTRWPEAESEALVQELVGAIESPIADREGGGALDRAARTWAVACPSTATMMLRLAQLRGVLADETTRDVPGRVDRVRLLVDAVTIAANEQAAALLESAALTDPLTGAGNRRAFARDAPMMFEGAQAAGASVCVVAIDLDGLKRTNDTRGHEAGDRAIVSLAGCVRRVLRDSDRIFRTGGDEFVVIVPGAPAAFASELVARSKAFGAPPFSWGAADSLDGRTFEEVLAVADRRLYSGRKAVRMMAEPAGTVRGARDGGPPGPGTSGMPAWSGLPGWRGTAARLLGHRRPADLFIGGVAGVVVGVIVLALTSPGTVTCGGGACTGIDIVRVCAIVAIVAGACSFVAGFVVSVARRGPAGPP
jgi:GGDEF domain-containing protein